MMSKPLFDAFDPVSAKAWKQKIQLDLKGADYNKTLIWQSPEGIAIKPFYHADDGETEYPSAGFHATNWTIGQTLYAGNAELANTRAIQAATGGVDSICFVIPSEAVSPENLVADIDTGLTEISWKPEFLSNAYINRILNLPDSRNFRIDLDPIGQLARTGNWYQNMDGDLKGLAAILSENSACKNLVSIDGALYQNAGANMVQQLAYMLGHANEYMNVLEARKTIDASRQLELTFRVAIGTDYFFEIAKLRALRMLFASLAAEYPGISETCHISASPSRRNKAIYDYNTNMLRTTTECMAAVLGGANTITNLPYDAIYHKDNDFGDRIARNQLLILKHESYFDKVANPADGSYYVEALTEQLAEKALVLFKDIEANGGFIKQLMSGTIQRKLKESTHKEQQQFDTGDKVLLGTNKFPNPEDRMAHDLELYPFVKTKVRKTLIEPIIERRLAETVEQERLNEEG